MRATKDQLASMIQDLLTIAKIAQPPSIFAVDPRVKKAQAFLVALGAVPPLARPPNTGPDPLSDLLGDIVDLRPIDSTAMVLDWDLVDGILAARENGLSQDDNEALNFIVREWLTSMGYLPLPVDADRAS